MPTSDPGLRRVTVHAGAQAVDLTLPAAVPVATLIPSIVDILGDRGASPATAARYQLSALGAPALPNATTLAQCGIRDGAVLVLHKSSAQPPTPRCDDVAEAVAAALDTTARPQCQRTTRLSGALAASCITAGGGLMLVRNALGTNVTRYSDATAGVVAAAGLAALLFAVIACRTYRDPIAGLTLSVIATIFGAVAGLLAVPGVPGVHSVLVAAMAAAATSVLAMRITGCGGITLTAVACCAVVVAAATLVGAITAAPVPAIGSLATLASFGLLEVSARMAVLLAGLSPRLPPALNPDDADALPTTDRLTTRANRADAWLTSLLAAFAAAALQPYSPLVAIVTALVMPPILAAATKGKYYLRRTHDGIDLPMYDEHGNPSAAVLTCHVCHQDFERPDMLACQTHGAHVCSLCLSTDKQAEHVLPGLARAHIPGDQVP